jgi:VanZ family protein
MSNKRRELRASTARIKTGSRGFLCWLSAWLPVALCISIVIMESTPAFGSDRTSHPLRWLFQLVFGPVNDAAWEMAHHLLRKTGHFVGYGLVGLAWLRAWRMTRPQARFLFHAALALAGTALVASWDEWHQCFLPNRTGSPWDVLLDCCGAMATMAMAWLFLERFRGARPEIPE